MPGLGGKFLISVPSRSAGRLRIVFLPVLEPFVELLTARAASSLYFWQLQNVYALR
jgi:hypothetical protein